MIEIKIGRKNKEKTKEEAKEEEMPKMPLPNKKEQREREIEEKKERGELIPLSKDESIMDKKKIFGWFGKLKPMSQYELDKQGPFLVLIDDDGTGEIYKRQEAGRIQLRKGKYNELHPKKLLTIFLPDGRYMKCWIHSINETYSYPLEPMLDAELGHKTITGIQANTANLAEARKLGTLKMWKQIAKLIGYIILGTIALWFIGDVLGMWDSVGGWLNNGGAEATKETVKTIPVKI